MRYSMNGKMMFDDIYEMYYHLFMEIGLSTNHDQLLYDQDTGALLKYKDKFIKATTIPQPIYAGRNDILFEPYKNYNLMVTIMGYYIDKESKSEYGDNIGFIAQYIEDNPDKTKQSIVVKTRRGDFASQYYTNIYLGYIECIFKLANSFDVDLSNLDFEYTE